MEQVLLLDEQGNPTGTAPKHSVHTQSTPLHLAFSCWVLSADGQLLLTRRALSKLTWPGVWTNSFCGHPSPEEVAAATGAGAGAGAGAVASAATAAVYRRAETELGLPQSAFASLDLVLPDFRYRAVDSSGVVENEICPVFVARLNAPADAASLAPNPDEVDSWAWVHPGDLIATADAAPFLLSPWLIEEFADPRLRARVTATA